MLIYHETSQAECGKRYRFLQPTIEMGSLSMSKKHSPESEKWLSMSLGETIEKIFLTTQEKNLLGETIVSRLVWIDQNIFNKSTIPDDEMLKVYSKEVMILKSLMLRLGVEDKISLAEYVFYKAQKILEKSKKRT